MLQLDSFVGNYICDQIFEGAKAAGGRCQAGGARSSGGSGLNSSAWLDRLDWDNSQFKCFVGGGICFNWLLGGTCLDPQHASELTRWVKG